MTAALRVLRAELRWLRAMQGQAIAEREACPGLRVSIADHLATLAIEEAQIVAAIEALTDDRFPVADPRQADLFGARQ